MLPNLIIDINRCNFCVFHFCIFSNNFFYYTSKQINKQKSCNFFKGQNLTAAPQIFKRWHNIPYPQFFLISLMQSMGLIPEAFLITQASIRLGWKWMTVRKHNSLQYCSTKLILHQNALNTMPRWNHENCLMPSLIMHCCKRCVCRFGTCLIFVVNAGIYLTRLHSEGKLLDLTGVKVTDKHTGLLW